MERIVLEVDDLTAKRWLNSSPKKRSKVSDIIVRVLEPDEESISQEGRSESEESAIQKLMEQNKEDMPQYQKFLDEIGEKAVANGLTQEIIDKLLKEDE